MATYDDFPPQIIKKDAKKTRTHKKRNRTVKRKDLEDLICLATETAQVASKKGFHIVSPEAIQCVKTLRQMRALSLTPRLITETNAFRAIQFLATNGNPKIRSESRSVLDHWRVTFFTTKSC
ncbi:unnamed protein product [Cochlearia groenlandica]